MELQLETFCCTAKTELNYTTYNIFGTSITKTFLPLNVLIKHLHWNFQYEQLELEKQFAILKLSWTFKLSACKRR